MKTNDYLVKRIKNLFHYRSHDTMEIAAILRVPEHEIYNRMNLATALFQEDVQGWLNQAQSDARNAG